MNIQEDIAALQTAGQREVAAAKALWQAAKDDNRELTTDEQADYDRHTKAAQAKLAQIRTLKDDLAVIEKANEIGEALGMDLNGGSHQPAHAKDGQRLTFKNMAGPLTRSIRPDGQKALSPSGSAVVGQEFAASVTALGQPATSLLDVLPVVQHSIPEFAYLRQTTRTNNAAVVAAGGLKPTSVYSVTRIENALAVVAHLSEGIPRHWLLDNSSLEAFLRNELEYGLAVAVEASVLAQVNGTSGIQAQAYATSVLATIRKGVTRLETAGYTASAFVLHPSDWEGVELGLASQAAIEHLSLPYDPATRRLFGVPVATSNAQTAGVGHVLASGAVAIDTDTRGVDVQWSENATADSFGKNLVFARCESRYATSVFSPLGVVSLDLTP